MFPDETENQQTSDSSRRHVIVGAGITGLLHAWYALQANKEVLVLEALDQAGGLIHTIHHEYGLIETAANGIINSSLFENLCDALALNIFGANSDAKRRFIYHNGEMRRLPLKLGQKIRLFHGIAFRDARVKPGERLADWGHRVLGRSSVDAILQPAFGGIYAGDVRKMSAELVLKQRILGKGSMMRQLRLGRKQKSHLKARRSGMVSLQFGMGSLVQALEHYIRTNAKILYNTPVQSIAELRQRWPASQYTVACGLGSSVRMLQDMPGTQANALPDSKLHSYNLLSVTRFGYEPIVKKKGFGVLFGPEAPVRTRGILFNNYIFPGRVKRNRHSETFIYGGAFDNDILKLSDLQIEQMVEQDRAILQPNGTTAGHMQISRWPAALPAYDDALMAFNQWLDTNLPADLRVEGNFRYGVGLSTILERAWLLNQKES